MANKNEVKLIVTADTKGAAASIQGFGSQLKSHWLELSAMAAGAFFTIKILYNEFAAAAEREEKRMAFTNLATTFHTNADSIIADLKRMSGQSITTSRAIELAGKSMLSGLDPRAMPGLMEFAKTMSNITGEKPADTFGDLTRAIITGQDRMLRMQRITVDFDKAQKDLATSLGGTKEQLNEQQIQYANLAALLETASTMTQRLGADIVTMDDKLAANATSMEESLTRVKDAIYQAFGTPALGILKAFAWELEQIVYLTNFGKAAYQRVKGLFSTPPAPTPAPANELAGAHRGATSLKDLGFTFDEQLGPGLQSLKTYTEELKASLGEIAKSEKDLTKEATNQIKDREAAYKNMYEALRFDTEKYYTFQKGLLEKQRDEEISITGDLKLAWEAYYARLQELEEQRILRSDDFLGGIKVYYAELEREGITWAGGAKDLMEGTAQAMQDAFSAISFDAMQLKLKTLGDYLRSFLTSIQQSISKVFGQLAAQGIMMGIGALFGTPTAGGPIMVHSGGYIPRFHAGGLSSDEVPAILQRGEYVINRRAVENVGRQTLDRVNQGDTGRSSRTNNYFIMDQNAIEAYSKMSERQLEARINQLIKDNRLKQIRR